MITKSVIIVLLCTLLATSLTTNANASKFRDTITTLTINDLPSLEAPASSDDDIAIAPLEVTTGKPSAEALSSFQQFIDATTLVPTSLPTDELAVVDLMGFSGSGEDDGVVFGYQAWTKRVPTSVTGAYNLSVTLESTTSATGVLLVTPSLRDRSSDDIIAGGTPLRFNTSSLPTTVTSALGSSVVASPETTYTLAITTSDGTTASDSTLRVLFKTGASWVFDLAATITGRSVSFTQTVNTRVDTYYYLIQLASASRPTIAYVIANGVAKLGSVGQETNTITIPGAATAYGDYIIYVVQVSGYADDTIKIAIGAELTVTYASPCAASPCTNGGTCSGTSETAFTCSCPLAYTGYLCQEATKCNASPCMNGATCTNATASPYYYCSCATGYSGDICATKTANETRPTASVRVVQTLSLDIPVAEYPTYKTNYAASLTSALGMSASRFSWVYFGPKRTTTAAHGFTVQAASDYDAQFDILAPTSGDNSTTATLSAESLLTNLQEQMANPNSTFRQTSYGAAVTGTYQTCSDGSTISTGSCPTTTVSSSSSSSTGSTDTSSSTGEVVIGGDEPSSSNNTTYIVIGCAVGAALIIIAGALCYCHRQKGDTGSTGYGNGYGSATMPDHRRLSDTTAAGHHHYHNSGASDLQNVWEEAHPDGIGIEMNRTDQLTLSQQHASQTRIH